MQKLSLDEVNYSKKCRELLCKMGLPTDLPLSKDAVVSGSFVWHMLTADEKTTWMPNDIDIFIKRSVLAQFRQYLADKGALLKSFGQFNYLENTIVEEWVFPLENVSERTQGLFVLWKGHNSGFPDYPHNTKFWDYQTDKAKKQVKIQLIIPESEVDHISQMITGRFDFPTLESYFDGTIMVFSNKQHIEQRISNIRDCAPWLDKNYIKSMMPGRIKKYEERGLQIVR